MKKQREACKTSNSTKSRSHTSGPNSTTTVSQWQSRMWGSSASWASHPRPPTWKLEDASHFFLKHSRAWMRSSDRSKMKRHLKIGTKSSNIWTLSRARCRSRGYQNWDNSAIRAVQRSRETRFKPYWESRSSAIRSLRMVHWPKSTWKALEWRTYLSSLSSALPTSRWRTFHFKIRSLSSYSSWSRLPMACRESNKSATSKTNQ